MHVIAWTELYVSLNKIKNANLWSGIFTMSFENLEFETLNFVLNVFDKLGSEQVWQTAILE